MADHRSLHLFQKVRHRGWRTVLPGPSIWGNAFIRCATIPALVLLRPGSWRNLPAWNSKSPDVSNQYSLSDDFACISVSEDVIPRGHRMKDRSHITRRHFLEIAEGQILLKESPPLPEVCT
jgi:hypothetical protein